MYKIKTLQDLSDVFKKIREEEGLSQFALAKMSGYGTNTIGNIEKMRVGANYLTLVDILESVGYELVVRKTPPKDSGE